jgi:hypothetical protein
MDPGPAHGRVRLVRSLSPRRRGSSTAVSSRDEIPSRAAASGPLFYRFNKIVSEVRSHQGAGIKEEKYRRPEAMIVDGMKADSHEWNSGLGRPGHDNRARGAFPGERRRLYLTFFLFLPSWPHTQKKGQKCSVKMCYGGRKTWLPVATGTAVLERVWLSNPTPPAGPASFDPMLPKHGPRSPVACKSDAVLQQ